MMMCRYRERMGGMKRWFRDWRRGWSDDDLECALLKVADPANRKPGGMIPMSAAEMRAYVAHYREQFERINSVPACWLGDR